MLIRIKVSEYFFTSLLDFTFSELAPLLPYPHPINFCDASGYSDVKVDTGLGEDAVSGCWRNDTTFTCKPNNNWSSIHFYQFSYQYSRKKYISLTISDLKPKTRPLHAWRDNEKHNRKKTASTRDMLIWWNISFFLEMRWLTFWSRYAYVNYI